MGKYNYESLKTAQQETQSTHTGTKKDFPRVGYFWLSDNKPSAIVRFDVSSQDDLEIVDVHNVKITKDNKTVYRLVACLRNNDEPFKNCPLCAKDVKTRSTQVFVKMIEYYINKDGQVVAAPVVWARYSSFADELVSLLNDYGDLRDHLFKVTRDKSSGKTKYLVRYQPEMGIYTEDAGYTKDFSAFNGLLINKHSYMERTFEELETFVNTGEMASRKPVSESKNLENVIANTKEEKEVEQALGMTQETPVVESPVPTNDELPFDVRGGRISGNTLPNTNVTGDDNNPTTVRRRRYDFTEDTTTF